MKKAVLMIGVLLAAAWLYDAFVYVAPLNVAIYNDRAQTISGSLKVNGDTALPFSGIKPTDFEWVTLAHPRRGLNDFTLSVAGDVRFTGTCRVPGKFNDRRGTECQRLYTVVNVKVTADRIICQWACGYSD